ncbi:MAG: PAS domain S-box protein [Bacteroidales bacterium]|nr:PAS domain S-box protein [Bacteroidales bacterium]
MNQIKKNKKSSGLLIFILIALNFGIALISAGYFLMERNRSRHEIVSQLQSISDVKANQIVDWRRERLSDARYLSKSHEISLSFKILSEDTGNMHNRLKLFDNLNAMFLNGKYEAMLAVNKKKECFFSIPESLALELHMIEDITKSGNSGEFFMGDMYLDKDSSARIDILIPVTGSRSLDTVTAGWIILRINPEKQFYNLMESLPVVSKTLVVDLVRKEGEEIVLLSRKKFPKVKMDPSLINPMTFINYKAVNGFKGVLEGIDSDGKTVIAVTRPVPESDWYLVVKVEKSEAYADLRKIMLTTSALAFLLMAALTSSVLLFWQRHRGEVENLEQEQKQLSERYDWLSQYANDVILLYDHDLRILQVNDKAVAKYGYSHEELMEMTMDMLRSSRTRDELKDKLSEITNSGGQRYETIHQRKDGTEFPVEESAKFISTQGENCFQSIIRDITERKRIEKALHDSEDRMRLITNSVPQIVWTAKADGSFDYFNSRFEAITGLLPFKGSAVTDSVHPDDIEGVKQSWERAIHEGNEFQIEFRLRLRDGSYRWFINTGIPFYDDHGKILKWFGSATDVEELKRSAQELRRRELLLRNAVNNLPSSFTIYDDQGRIEYINDFSLVRSDMTAEEAIGKREEDIFPEEVTRNYLPVLSDTYKTKEPQVIECLINYADAPRFVIYHFVPTLDENNNIYKVLGMAYDITERKNSEEKLKEAIEKAEESDRLKSAFLANISHEIRTPLNAIMGFSQMIQKTFREDEQLNGYVDIIMASAEQLLDIIKQMLEISQLESGGSHLNPIRFSVAGLLNELYQNYCLQERNSLSNGLRFILELDETLKAAPDVVTDRDKLYHILRNLLDNAFKFTRTDGTISFGCKIMDNDMLQFFVRDTGIGIEESKLQFIFNTFRQADETYTRSYGGIGLGLSICRNLVGILGGEIWAESKPGKGSVFYFKIPCSKT